MCLLLLRKVPPVWVAQTQRQGLQVWQLRRQRRNASRLPQVQVRQLLQDCEALRICSMERL